jgi:hypothetical protein
MAEALEDAVESKDRRVALIIAILALFLALSEAGAKNAQHRSTEQNIEASDLFNFYQAKKLRASLAESDATQMALFRQNVSDPKIQEAMDKQVAAWKAAADRLATEKPDGMEAILERAKEASAGRELSNRRLEHLEYASGLLQIAIVLASAAIITGMVALIWLSVALGGLGGALMALGYFAPTALTFLG